MPSAHNVSETHQGRLREIAQNVFSYVQPDGTWFINNMGLIVGETEAISIDTTSTERRNRSYIDAIEALTSNPVKLVVNTHHHADHTHGNFMFPDAAIVAHSECRRVMVETGIPNYRSAFPDVEWGELKFRAPDITISGLTTLHLDDLAIELAGLGYVAHTEGDLLVWIPSRRVLFTGDLIFNGGTPFALFGSIEGTLRALDVIENYEAEVIVPGHGPAFKKQQTSEVLNSQRDYLRFVQATALLGVRKNRSPLEQAMATDLGIFSSLTDSERLAGNLHVAYREISASGYIWQGTAQAIKDMIVYNKGQLPHCVA